MAGFPFLPAAWPFRPHLLTLDAHQTHHTRTRVHLGTCKNTVASTKGDTSDSHLHPRKQTEVRKLKPLAIAESTAVGPHLPKFLAQFSPGTSWALVENDHIGVHAQTRGLRKQGRDPGGLVGSAGRAVRANRQLQRANIRSHLLKQLRLQVESIVNCPAVNGTSVFSSA